MKAATISRGGQVSIPAEVRRRWGTRQLLVEDRGDTIVLRPIPDDPIGAAIGALGGPGPDSDTLRARVRDEEALADERRRGRP